MSAIEQVAPSRADYMAGNVSFAEFYRAVNATGNVVVRDADMLERVRAALRAGDEHLNTIPLGLWDNMALRYQSQIARALRQHGDFYSMAGGVCCLKQAARDMALSA